MYAEILCKPNQHVPVSLKTLQRMFFAVEIVTRSLIITVHRKMYVMFLFKDMQIFEYILSGLLGSGEPCHKQSVHGGLFSY